MPNGAKETRTPDPLHAMQVLYQLSYGPINAGDAVELVPPSYPSLHRRTLTLVAIPPSGGPAPEPGRQAIQSAHRQDSQPPT